MKAHEPHHNGEPSEAFLETLATELGSGYAHDIIQAWLEAYNGDAEGEGQTVGHSDADALYRTLMLDGDLGDPPRCAEAYYHLMALVDFIEERAVPGRADQ
jgi:hypothetical protein